MQLQLHGPLPLTELAVPALHRLEVGAEVNVPLFDVPQTPLTAVVFTVRLTDRVVLPLLFVVFVKVTVPLYDPGDRLFALLLIDTDTVALAPAAKLPLVGDTVYQLPFEAVQLIELPPVFCNVYDALDGLNAPPCAPDDVNPVDGVTLSTPGVVFTVRLTDRVVLPLLFVVFVKVTVPLYDPGVRLFAPLLIDTYTVVLAPAAKLPLVGDTVYQLPFDAVQLINAPPVFWSVYVVLVGLKAPPCVPDDEKFVVGVTDKVPAAVVVKDKAAPLPQPALLCAQGWK